MANKTEDIDLTGMTDIHEMLLTATKGDMERLIATSPYPSSESLALALLTATIWEKPRGWLSSECGISEAAENSIMALVVAEAVAQVFG